MNKFLLYLWFLKYSSKPNQKVKRQCLCRGNLFIYSKFIIQLNKDPSRYIQLIMSCLYHITLTVWSADRKLHPLKQCLWYTNLFKGYLLTFLCIYILFNICFSWWFYAILTLLETRNIIAITSFQDTLRLLAIQTNQML